VHGVGREVYHVKAGQRVVVSSHIVADENAPEPAQFLFGITAGPAGKAFQTDWRDLTLAEYALAPKSSVTPVEGLDSTEAPALSVLPRFAVPYGGLLRGRLAAGETIAAFAELFDNVAVVGALKIGAGDASPLLPGNSGRVVHGQFQGSLKVVFNLREGVLCKCLEVRVCAVLDLVTEKRRVAFLIVNLALHIVAVEPGAGVGLE
jgi:hypothetical protein